MTYLGSSEQGNVQFCNQAFVSGPAVTLRDNAFLQTLKPAAEALVVIAFYRGEMEGQVRHVCRPASSETSEVLRLDKS